MITSLRSPIVLYLCQFICHHAHSESSMQSRTSQAHTHLFSRNLQTTTVRVRLVVSQTSLAACYRLTKMRYVITTKLGMHVMCSKQLWCISLHLARDKFYHLHPNAQDAIRFIYYYLCSSMKRQIFSWACLRFKHNSFWWIVRLQDRLVNPEHWTKSICIYMVSK